MGLYNIVEVSDQCNNCHRTVLFKIQFKYGDLYLYEYCIGDKIKWGKPRHNVGEPNMKQVVVPGIAEKCPNCGYENQGDYEVWLKEDYITSVKQYSGEFDDINMPDGYILINP